MLHFKHTSSDRSLSHILVGTKDLKNGLADRTSKSETKSRSIAFKSKSTSESLEPKSKSKSSKNGLKSGLEYYKSECHFTESQRTS